MVGWGERRFLCMARSTARGVRRFTGVTSDSPRPRPIDHARQLHPVSDANDGGVQSMSTTSIRRFVGADTDTVVELSLAAWSPVFQSFHAVLGDDLYRRVYPDWRRHQAASVRDALRRN